MDEDILSELTSDFDAGSADTSATAASEAGTSEGGEQTATTAEPEAGDTTEAEAGTTDAKPEPLNLAKLEALAKERRAQRTQDTTTQATEAKPEPLTAKAIADAMREGDTFQAQIREAWKAGDIEAMAKLMADDPSKADAAGAFERMTKRALDPNGSRASDQIAALKAELAELREKVGQVPDGVVTQKHLEERQQAESRAASERAFIELVTGEEMAEQTPILANIDRSVALEYAWQANALLLEHGSPFDLSDVSRVAEEIASSKLGGLLARNQGAAAATKSGSNTTHQAAGAATAAKTKGGGAIDNRAASTTAATMPDPDDEEAWEQRLTSIAAGSRA